MKLLKERRLMKGYEKVVKKLMADVISCIAFYETIQVERQWIQREMNNPHNDCINETQYDVIERLKYIYSTLPRVMEDVTKLELDLSNNIKTLEIIDSPKCMIQRAKIRREISVVNANIEKLLKSDEIKQEMMKRIENKELLKQYGLVTEYDII